MARHAPTRLWMIMAARSLWAHKVKNAIVGSILFFGTLLVVVGGSLLTSVQDSMTRSITSSMSGDLQVYAADAPDPLALFGGGGMGQPDNGEIPRFADVEAALSKVDGVAAIVPMGLTQATVFGPSELDRVIDQLSEAVDAGDTPTVEALVPQVRRIAASLHDEQERAADVTADKDQLAEDLAALDQVQGDAFWAEDFAQDPHAAIAFIERKLSPLAGDGRMFWLRTLGTDMAQFPQTFDRFEIVDGEPIPPGKRGFLFSKRTYERQIKNRVAVQLDDVYEKVTLKGHSIDDEVALSDQVKRNARQYARVTFGLSAEDAAAMETDLRRVLPEVDGGLDDLVEAFLTVDDTNLEERYQQFYSLVAPRIRLYDVPIGGSLPLRTYTKAGYVRTVNVKVYGTYQFQGLEKSDLAQAANLCDLVTFRDLYGKMSGEQQAELSAIKAAVGVADLSAADAEAALFGGGDLVEEVDAGGGSFDFDALDDARIGEKGRIDDQTYTESEMRDGLAINAAVVLDDGVNLWKAKAALEKAIEEQGLNLQVVDWQTASGIVGQLLYVMGAVLVIALVIIFFVALIIINNSMVMAAMDRVGEIGTMRAIGARRGMVVTLFIGETAILGLVAGTLGSAVGAGLVLWMGKVGIPAFADILVLLFAGPRLYPAVGAPQIAFAMLSVVAIAVISTLYPAWLAARIQPVVAMQRKG